MTKGLMIQCDCGSSCTSSPCTKTWTQANSRWNKSAFF